MTYAVAPLMLVPPDGIEPLQTRPARTAPAPDRNPAPEKLEEVLLPDEFASPPLNPNLPFSIPSELLPVRV